MTFHDRVLRGIAIIGFLGVLASPGLADQYLVIGSGGPGFSSPQEAVRLLEGRVIPTFEVLEKLKAEKKLIAGGLPVGERALIFILDVKSNEEVGRILRNIPLWPLLSWKVTPLQSIDGRAKEERAQVEMIKKRTK